MRHSVTFREFSSENVCPECQVFRSWCPMQAKRSPLSLLEVSALWGPTLAFLEAIGAMAPLPPSWCLEVHRTRS